MITSNIKIFSATLCACSLALMLTACNAQVPEQPVAETTPGAVKEQSARYQARVRRTSYGVAHIEAANLESLGFGEGYAQAEDHLCTIADQIVKVRSERAAYFGAGPDNAHLLSDAGLLALNIYDRAAEDLAKGELVELYEGYAAGYKREAHFSSFTPR